MNRLSWLFALVLLVGCQRQLSQQGHDDTPLRTLSAAYLAATQKLERPPKGPEELAPFLEPGKEIDSLLTSPADGQPYEILWGTDPRAGMDLKPLVIGYEKVGKDGNRFVFTAMGVMLMDPSGFASANFPPGHKPEFAPGNKPE